mmetsp:Transcript_66898/g.105854  ORF Transcript_66898/g.105854 Transcript_66898/m.105854 type:complete len:98 (+) Transcript_66898:65-358(+)
MSFTKSIQRFLEDNAGLCGVLAFVSLTILGIGVYAGLFTGGMDKDSAIVFCFVSACIVALGGYMYYASTQFEKYGKKKGSGSKKSKKNRVSGFIGGD